MKVIKGIEIKENKSLDYNLDKIRLELLERGNFWSNYNNAIDSYTKKDRKFKITNLYRILLFLGLMPKYFIYLISFRKIETLIKEAEAELIEHYDKPKTKVKRFRLQCQQEKELYNNELLLIDKELKKQSENLNSTSIGKQTKNEIKNLIVDFEKNKINKQHKYEFYEKCELRLIEIEEQIRVKGSIEKSRLLLEQLNDRLAETSKQKEIEKELELYDYYSDIIDNISHSLKKLKLDKEEKIEKLELNEMLIELEIND